MKGTSHAFLLLALLPIARFIHPNKRICSVFQDRLTHEALDFILRPLKTAAQIGIMMSDPVGNLRYCFTPLASYIVDTPEAQMLSGVGGRASPVTMAGYKQLGDSYRHEPRCASTTLAQLAALEADIDPWDIDNYVRKAKEFHLNGVHRPFWRDWRLSDPSNFLTPEPLHHWHKQFWDHDLKWCICLLGYGEIDFRFTILQPITGYRHFKEGVSKLKQVTGRDHRNVQRFLVGIITDVAPKAFVTAIRALMDFRYLAQAPVITEQNSLRIQAALNEFHNHKQAILAAGARVGKKNRPIDHWYIPKLELMQSVAPHIFLNGVPIQWSADITEHTHITEVKNPVRSSNNHNDDSQICRFLDRREKCHRFDLATAARYMHTQHQPLPQQDEDHDASDADDIDENNNDLDLLSANLPSTTMNALPRLVTDYFQKSERLRNSHDVPIPFRTFSNSSTAFHLTRDPTFKQMLIDDVAALYKLPDLRPALLELLYRIESNRADLQDICFPIGGHRAVQNYFSLPFDSLQVWCRIRIQKKAYHYPHSVQSAQTVNAHPPDDKWPLGRYDTVIVNTNPQYLWPTDNMKGQDHLKFGNNIDM
jgi:hypothetical protein